MDTDLFDYELPREMIAQSGARPRDSSRLFLIDASGERVRHRHLIFRDIEDILEKGDILVLNRTRVLPARVKAEKITGGKAEVLLLGESDDNRWTALVKGKRISEGSVLLTPDPELVINITERMNEGRCRITLERGKKVLTPEEVREWVGRWGLMPTPPYIRKALKDPEEYQTVYGDKEGSVAAPTAGLHFTEGLLERLKEKGVRIVYVVLHVGIGTFAPVKTRDIGSHVMEEEWFELPKGTADVISGAVSEFDRTGKRRIWAVGTTVMRTLESAFDREGRIITASGKTGLFITPGHRFHLPYKGFITNFHLPRSTPLILASAFYDREGILRAYEEAKEMGYRFYSLGDAMMIRRHP